MAIVVSAMGPRSRRPSRGSRCRHRDPNGGHLHRHGSFFGRSRGSSGGASRDGRVRM